MKGTALVVLVALVQAAIAVAQDTNDNNMHNGIVAIPIAMDPTHSRDVFSAVGGISLANPLLAGPDRPKDCPPCFNCLLEAFPCSHFAPCNAYDGRCVCPPGFAGDNCSVPGAVITIVLLGAKKRRMN